MGGGEASPVGMQVEFVWAGTGLGRPEVLIVGVRHIVPRDSWMIGNSGKGAGDCLRAAADHPVVTVVVLKCVALAIGGASDAGYGHRVGVA